MFKNVLILVLTVVNFANAQNKIELGIMGAYDFTTGAGSAKESPYSLKNNSGFEVGFSGYKRISKLLYLNVGLHFANRNFSEGNISQSGYTKTGHKEYKWNDINLPLGLNLRIPVLKRLSITSTAGVTLATGIKNTETWYLPNGEILKYKRRLHLKDRWFPSLSLGVLYKLGESYSIMLMPTIMPNLQFWGTTSYDLRTTLLYNFK